MSVMKPTKERMLAEMGIKPIWRLRATTETEPEVLPEQVVAQESDSGNAPAVRAPIAAVRAIVVAETEPEIPVVAARQPQPGNDGVSSMDWPELQRAVAECRKCRLCERRKQAVLGVGDPDADWMLVGEGPGAEEDQRGEPFVGQAGKLLDAMLSSVGLKRGENVYIANAVKCRPPGNRTPEADEIAACRPYLERQIALVRPKLLVAMGRPAAQTLLEAEVKVGAARKRVFEYLGVPVVVTYHPAYLLRNLNDKIKAWEDLCFAVDQMERSGG
jgi:uracil-DNA glycosylase